MHIRLADVTDGGDCWRLAETDSRTARDGRIRLVTDSRTARDGWRTADDGFRTAGGGGE